MTVCTVLHLGVVPNDVFLMWSTGDNILTAISVARDCDMVGTSDRILVAKASPPIEDQPASLVFEPAHVPNPSSTEVSVSF